MIKYQGLLLACLMGSIRADYAPITPAPASSPDREVWITVFVHGTVGLRNGLSFSACIDLIRDEIEHTRYKKIVETIRENPFFYSTQPMQEVGLKKIDLEHPTCASTLFARMVHKVSKPTPTTFHHYYTFGWSGLLSHTERTKEAELLYEALHQEYTSLSRLHPEATIRIRLMGYSHGGSVCLNLAQAHKKRSDRFYWYIDQLILIAMPVQNETINYIYEPLFKKIYHVYSKKDIVQKLDCFSTKRFFSQRRFKPTQSKTLPEKLVQVEIKIKSPRNPQKPLTCTIDRSPHHSEFWFFGWTPTSYRENFPLYPLPTSVLLPR